MLQAFDNKMNPIDFQIYEDDIVLEVYPVYVNSAQYHGPALIIEFLKDIGNVKDYVKILSPKKSTYCVSLFDCEDAICQ